MARTGQQRLDAIPGAIERRDEFRARVDVARGDLRRCAELMAEAIDMQIEANGLEPVGRNGKKTVCVEAVMAAHCMIAARDAYRSAKPFTPFNGDDEAYVSALACQNQRA